LDIWPTIWYFFVFVEMPCIYNNWVGRRLRLYREKKEAYWLDRLSQGGNATPQLWRSLTTMGRDRDTSGASGHTADQFASLFARKVDEVRTSTAGRPAPPVYDSAPTLLSSFRECTTAEVRRIILSNLVHWIPCRPSWFKNMWICYCRTLQQ